MEARFFRLSIIIFSIFLCIYAILAESQVRNSASSSSSSSSSVGRPRPPTPPPPPPLPRPPPPPGPTRHPPQPESVRSKNNSNNDMKNKNKKKSKGGKNAGKLIGEVFAGIAAVLQVCVVGFLVFKRRQLLKDKSRYHNCEE